MHLISKAALLRAAREAVAVVLGAGLLMGVVVADGRPVVFADTNIYVWMGQMQIRPVRYALSPVLGGPSSAADDPDLADEAPADMRLRHTEMGARSAWFGTLLYLVSSAGTLWAYAGVQSLAASLAVRALWRSLLGGGPAVHLVVMALLSLGTTLPFFAGFAMPDLWAGVGLVAMAGLLFAREGLGRAERFALFGLSLAALTFHQSNPLVAVGATLASVGGARTVWRVPWRRLSPGLASLGVALCCAVALQAGYALAVRSASGDTLRSPPFLAARILADGPGREYLRQSCARGANWALCRFRDHPLDDSQVILWSGDRSRGLYGLTRTEERIRIDREQIRFVLAAVAYDPGGAVRAAALNTWRTLTNVELEDPLRDPHFYLTDPEWRDTFIADLVHDMGPCDPDERGCKPRFDPLQLAPWHGAVCAAAVAWIGWTAGRRRTRALFNDQLGPVLVLLLSAVLVNAAVTGILSGPFARYGARVAWLPPFAALLLIGAAFKARGAAKTPDTGSAASP